MTTTIAAKLKGKANAQGQIPLFLRYTWNRTQYFKSLRVNLNPIEWDDVTETVRTSHPEAEKLNLLVALGKMMLQAAVDAATDKGDWQGISGAYDQWQQWVAQPSTFPKSALTKREYDVFKLLIAKKTGKVKSTAVPQSGPVVPTGAAKLKDALGEYITMKRGVWQDLTVRSYQSLANIIEEYEHEYDLTWYLETLTNKDIVDWQDWLMKTKDYKNSTLAKQVKKLKQFLKDVTLNDTYELNPRFKLERVKPVNPITVDAAIVTLTAKEIKALYAYDFPNNSKLDRTRDLFCLMCYTGLRHSDVIRLDRADIQHGFIKMTMQKTMDTTNIPLFAQAALILEKYNYRLVPLAISNQKFNEGLKELFNLPEVLVAIPTLTNPVRLPEERGNKRQFPTVPKNTIISSHMARKSFITMCLELGQPQHIVKEWSGHKTDSSFNLYVNAVQGQRAAATAVQDALNKL